MGRNLFWNGTNLKCIDYCMIYNIIQFLSSWLKCIGMNYNISALSYSPFQLNNHRPLAGFYLLMH
jgi:hypothetical protein